MVVDAVEAAVRAPRLAVPMPLLASEQPLHSKILLPFDPLPYFLILKALPLQYSMSSFPPFFLLSPFLIRRLYYRYPSTTSGSTRCNIKQMNGIEEKKKGTPRWCDGGEEGRHGGGLGTQIRKYIMRTATSTLPPVRGGIGLEERKKQTGPGTRRQSEGHR